MPKLRTCGNTNWLHSNRAENQVSVYAFRGTVALKVALDHFLLQGGHQHRARGRISLKKKNPFSDFFISTQDSVLFCLTNLTPLYNRPSELYVFNRVIGENVTGWLIFHCIFFFLVVYMYLP